MKHSSASFSRGTVHRVSLTLGPGVARGCHGPAQVLADTQCSSVAWLKPQHRQEQQENKDPSMPRRAGLYTASRCKPGPGSDEQQPRTTQTVRQLQANEAFSKGIWQL